MLLILAPVEYRPSAVMAANVIRRAPDQDANSRSEYKTFIDQIHTAYPDFSITSDGMAVGAGGGKMISEYVAFDTAALLGQLEAPAMPHAAE